MENYQAKISIIIPVYGVEKYLKECLDSVLKQTLQDLEIILIDDGGKDKCPQIIDEYAQKDSRIKAIHKQNGGYGHTCNKGLEIATGEYVAIVEPDDFIDPNMYEKLYELAKSNDADIVKSCFYKKMDTQKDQKAYKMKWAIDYPPPQNAFTIEEYPYFLSFHPSIWSAIYKNSFLKQHNLKFVEAPGAGWTDNPFQVQTMCLAKKIVYTDEAYYYWRCINDIESNDLKDYTLPFKRSEEIHNWLEQNNIDNEKILNSLYMRELAYINIVLNKKYSKEEFKNVKLCIEKMLARMDFRTIKNCKIFKKRLHNELITIKKNFTLFLFKQKFNKLRKSTISIRLNKKEKSIILLGKYWRFN